MSRSGRGFARFASIAARSGSAAALGLFLISTAVFAYIPSAASLLRRAAARVNEGGRSREATLTGILTVGGQPHAATLKLHFPLACVLDANGQGASAARSNDGSAMQVTDTGLGQDAVDLLRLACPLIAYRGQSAGQADLSLRAFTDSVGIAPTLAPTAFARLYDRIAIILGAQARELNRPQLWLYKDNAAPARLLALTNGTLDDLRLLQYGNPAASDWFPRVIELWRGPNLRARFETEETHGLNDAGDEEEASPDSAAE